MVEKKRTTTPRRPRPAAKPAKASKDRTAEIAEAYARIVRWHEQNGADHFKLAKGATERQLAAAERELGSALPTDIRIAWGLHNGGRTDAAWILTHGDLLSLEAIVAGWKRNRAWQEDDGWGLEAGTAKIKGPIKPVFWSPKRIPLTDNSGDSLTLDLDPPAKGVVGQVIDFDHEVGPTAVVATSWGAFLTQWARDLEAGKYVYFPDQKVVALPGAYARPGGVRRYGLPSGESWEIVVDGDRLTVTEIDASGGAFSRSSYPGAARAKKEFARLVAEKEAAGWMRIE